MERQLNRDVAKHPTVLWHSVTNSRRNGWNSYMSYSPSDVILSEGVASSATRKLRIAFVAPLVCFLIDSTCPSFNLHGPELGGRKSVCWGCGDVRRAASDRDTFVPAEE